MIVSCPNCKTKYKLNIIPDEKKSLSVRCKKCLASFPISFGEDLKGGKDIKILIAHDDYRVVNIIKKLLEKLEFTIITADNGTEAYNLTQREKPGIAIIDVALPGMFGFELCEKIKNNPDLRNTKIILVASIYDRTRYKRKPQNLYGADDYIEKHHIPDELVTKILSLTAKSLPIEKDIVISKREIPREELRDNRDILLEDKKIDKFIDRERESIRSAENNYIKKSDNLDDKAKRLARLIVSDIALYNQDIIKKVDINNYRDLLKMDVIDGVNHLKKRMPDISDRAESYIHYAFIELLKKEK